LKKEYKIDLAGMVFGRWIVISFAGKTAARNSLWLCRCSCGEEKVISSGSLRSGNSRSCGCLRKEIISKANTTHGKSHSRVYNTWRSMLQRCNTSTDSNFSRYGARGIKVCSSWRSFQQFYADMGDPPKGLSLEWQDNEGDYTPKNCIWANRIAQNNNRRTNRLLSFNREQHTVAEWARITGINNRTLLSRLRNGWTTEDALTREVQYHGKTSS